MLNSTHLQTLRAIDRGEAPSLQLDQVIDLILAQQAKIESKKLQLTETEEPGLFGTFSTLSFIYEEVLFGQKRSK
jgi:hypothetical protein